MTPDMASVAELRSEVLAGLTERERIVAADGRALRPADEQALGSPAHRGGHGSPSPRGDRRRAIGPPW